VSEQDATLSAIAPAPAPAGEAPGTPPAQDQGGQADEQQSEQQATPKSKADDDEYGGLPKGYVKTIERLTRQKAEERAQRQALEMRLQELESRLTQPQNQPRQAQPAQAQEPRREDFEDYEAYLEARADHRAQRSAQEFLAKQQAEFQAQRASAAQSELAQRWDQAQEKVRGEIEDYDAVVASSRLPLPTAMKQAIIESDVGPRIAYHLATHPDEHSRIAALSPLAQVKAIGKLEDKLQAAPPKPDRKSVV